MPRPKPTLAAMVLGLMLGTYLVFRWVVPAAAGLPVVDCRGMDPVACEDSWRTFAAEQADGLLPFLPVTRASVADSGKCPSIRVEWGWMFAIAQEC